MSAITTLLSNARDIINRARAIIQVQIQLSDIDINRNYQWDGGDGLLDFDARGAGTQQLSENMGGLANLLIDNPELRQAPYPITSEVQEYINGIAAARGITPEQAKQDYLRMLDLMNASGITLEPVDEYGTLSHLRFGYMVGDALEIDPAFASLMSEYGGLTGPGSNALNIDGNGFWEEVGGLVISNEALAYHAPTHDAFGFLKTHFDIGPGYCYVPDGGDCIAGNESGLSGQVSGINYWKEKLDVSPLDTIREAGGEIYREVNEAGREISGEFSEAGGEIWREASQGDVVGTGAEIIEGGAEVVWQTGEGIVESGWEVGEGVVETGWEAAKDIIPGL